MIERTATWAQMPIVGVVLLVLLVLTIVSYNLARNYHREVLSNFYRNKERLTNTFTDISNAIASYILLGLCATVNFSIFFTIALGRQSIWVLLASCGVVLAWLLLQWLLFGITGYCANISRKMRQFRRTFIFGFIGTGIVLYPIVVGMIYAPQITFTTLAHAGFVVIGLGVLIIFGKAIQLFFHGIDTACYLFLYLCTLEILPILLLKKAVNLVISGLTF